MTREHRAERTYEHEMYIEYMLNDPEFNPNQMVPGLFYELPFTGEELIRLSATVTDAAGAKILVGHPNASFRLKAKLSSFLLTEVEDDADLCDQ